MLELNHVYNMDCLEGLSQIPAESIDAIVTSPPYFSKNWNIWSSSEQYLKYISDRLILAHSKLKSEGVLFLNIGDIDFIRIHESMLSILIKAGAHYIGDFIWDKSFTYHEPVFVLSKKPLKHIPRVGGAYRFGPQTSLSFPEDLVEYCLKLTKVKYGTVLDPFMGFGTTGIVAKQRQWNYIGFEIDRETCLTATDAITRIDQ